MQGLGRVYSENGLIFDGNFEKGHLNGLGYLYNSETNIFYEGLFYENECNKLFKKSQGFQFETIVKHRSTQHKQASCFNNQLLVLDIAQILQGHMPLINLYRNNKNMGAEDMQSIVLSENNPLFNFIQKNKEFMEVKRYNLFFYPNQVIYNRQIFNTSSISSHHHPSAQPSSYPYEEYEFSLHEFQRQLDRPTLSATINSDNFQFNERQTHHQYNNSLNSNSGVFNNISNIYSKQKVNASPGQNKNGYSAMSTNQMNTRVSSPLQTKTFDSFVSYHNETETPLARTPKQKKYLNEQNAIERKLTFSNAVGSSHSSISQLQTKNPYFQIIPSSSAKNSDSKSNSMSKQLQNQTSTFNDNPTNNNSQRSQSPFSNSTNIKATKPQGNRLYEQIRNRSNTPNLKSRQNDNSNTNNSSYGLQQSRDINPETDNDERELANPYSQIQMNRQQLPYRDTQSSISNRNQYQSVQQNAFKSQLNMTHNSSNYSTSQNNNIQDLRSSSNSQVMPKSKIFNRPKSSMMATTMSQQSRETIPSVRFQTTNDTLKTRSISPIQQQQTISRNNIQYAQKNSNFSGYNDNYSDNTNRSQKYNTFKQKSPLRSIQKTNSISTSVNSRVLNNNSSNSNNTYKNISSRLSKKSESPFQNQRKSPVPVNNTQKQKENIKQVHLRLPSSFFN